MARTAAAEGAVQVEGLNDLRKALKTTDAELATELRLVLKGAAEIVAVRARSLAPHRSGALAASIKAGTSGSSALVRSNLPYANVIHWGGTTGPGHSRGHAGATTIKPSLFISHAIEQTDRAVVDEVQAGLDRLITRAGWH